MHCVKSPPPFLFQSWADSWGQNTSQKRRRHGHENEGYNRLAAALCVASARLPAAHRWICSIACRTAKRLQNALFDCSSSNDWRPLQVTMIGDLFRLNVLLEFPTDCLLRMINSNHTDCLLRMINSNFKAPNFGAARPARTPQKVKVRVCVRVCV